MSQTVIAQVIVPCALDVEPNPFHLRPSRLPGNHFDGSKVRLWAGGVGGSINLRRPLGAPSVLMILCLFHVRDVTKKPIRASPTIPTSLFTGEISNFCCYSALSAPFCLSQLFQRLCCSLERNMAVDFGHILSHVDCFRLQMNVKSCKEISVKFERSRRCEECINMWNVARLPCFILEFY